MKTQVQHKMQTEGVGGGWGYHAFFLLEIRKAGIYVHAVQTKQCSNAFDKQKIFIQGNVV